MTEFERGDRVINKRHPMTGHGQIVGWSDLSPFRVRVQYDDGRSEWLDVDCLIDENTTSCGLELS